MKVLHLLKTSVGGNWAVRLVRELGLGGVEVHVAVPGPGERVEEYQRSGATVHYLDTAVPITNPRALRSSIQALRVLTDSVKPDVIHSHFVITTLIARLALRDCTVPRIFQVPGPLHLEHSSFRMIDIYSSNDCDYWIASCEWTRQRYLRSGIGSDRVFLSYYGTDIDMFQEGNRAAARRRLGLKEDIPIIGMVAYLYPPKRYLGHRKGIKGHEILIEAMVRVREEMPEAVVVFVGKQWGGGSWYEERVKKQARQVLGDGAYFAGYRSDVTFIYPAFDVAVTPSLSENIGGAAESLLAGIPTIATAVGGLPDLIRPGCTGWLVPPGDSGALAEAILDALANPLAAKRIALAGRELAKEYLDVRKTAREVAAIYEEILMRRSSKSV